MFTTNVLRLLVFLSFAIEDCCATSAKSYAARDLQPVGCNETTTSRSKLSGAASCATNKTCAAFLYLLDGTCSLCRGDLVRSLGFILALVVFWPQHHRETWPLTNVVYKYTNRSLPGTATITTGAVVHLHGMFYDLSGFYIELRQDVPGNNISFQFRSSRDYMWGFPMMTMSSCKNTVWGVEVRVNPLPYPFVENTKTTLDVLVREDSYQIYIDQKFCCYYNFFFFMFMWIPRCTRGKNPQIEIWFC